jgi:nitrate reductase gamma subunit
MDPIGIVAIVGILVVAGCFGYLYRRDMNRYSTKMSKSPSRESLNTMTQTEDPA